MTTTKHGCHNRKPFKPWVPVKNGVNPKGGFVLDKIPFRMSADCQYTLTELGKVDDKCTGCVWRKL